MGFRRLEIEWEETFQFDLTEGGATVCLIFTSLCSSFPSCPAVVPGEMKDADWLGPISQLVVSSAWMPRLLVHTSNSALPLWIQFLVLDETAAGYRPQVVKI
jgi:hypothetical protein